MVIALARSVSAGLLIAVLIAPAPAPAQSAPERYDIAYHWNPSLAQVRVYRESLLRILGPQMESRLQIVRGDEAFGLIYDRNGDAHSTSSVAIYQARMLAEHGLPAPTPVLSRDWSLPPPTPESDTSAPKARAAAPPTPHALFEKELRVFLDRQRRQGRLASDERSSWSVYDLTSDEPLLEIDVDAPLQAASLVKPAFALAFFHRVRDGKLLYGPKSRRRLEAMIRDSDNRAANWVLRLLGGPAAAQRLLKRHYGQIFRDIQIVEYIPAGGKTYRNRASAADYTRFLRALWKQQLPGSREIKRMMGLPNRDRLRSGTRVIPSTTRVYDKTGSTRHLCGNIGILQVRGWDGRRYAYSVVGVIEKRRPARSYGRWIRARGNVIRDFSTLVFRKMQRRYPLSHGSSVAAR
jgi:beta-lactamase class A